jgi:hypothetical protein
MRPRGLCLGWQLCTWSGRLLTTSVQLLAEELHRVLWPDAARNAIDNGEPEYFALVGRNTHHVHALSRRTQDYDCDRIVDTSFYVVAMRYQLH